MPTPTLLSRGVKLDDIPPVPSATLVVTPMREASGVDLLGLRTAAERVAVSLMNGVTTISPLVRYLGLSAWTLRRYASLNGEDSDQSFRRFAHKVEAAVAFSSGLRESAPAGVVGRNEASRALSDDPVPLVKRLTKNLALDAYAGPLQELGILRRRRPVLALSEELGLPLAEELDRSLGACGALSRIDLDAAEQEVDRGDLRELGDRFPIEAPSGAERALLVDIVIPAKPRGAAAARAGAYAFLLWLSNQRQGPLTEADVFGAAIDPEVQPPEPLRTVSDGWLRFLVRDSLVAVHERAVADTIAALRDRSGTGYSPKDEVLAQMMNSDWAPHLDAAGLTGVGPATPASEFCSKFDELLGLPVSGDGLPRWRSPVNELTILNAALANPAGGSRACLIPAAWILADRRVGRPAIVDAPRSDDADAAGFSRIGVRQVVAPAVREWRRSSRPMREIASELVARSVDQHLRIAWSRLCNDPTKDVAALVSDGSQWMAQSDLKAGRASSRLYQAISWTRQLGLTSDEGLTTEGATILQRTLRELEATGRPS